METPGWLCSYLYTHAPMGTTVKAGVAGANGYAGMTLVNLLSRHPGVELIQLSSRSFAGKPYSEVFPLLELGGAHWYSSRILMGSTSSSAACRTTSARARPRDGLPPARA